MDLVNYDEPSFRNGEGRRQNILMCVRALLFPPPSLCLVPYLFQAGHLTNSSLAQLPFSTRDTITIFLEMNIKK
jgi:hypothetical protein